MTQLGEDRTADLKRATQRSFGYRWTHFADMVEANREHFSLDPAFRKGDLLPPSSGNSWRLASQ